MTGLGRAQWSIGAIVVAALVWVLVARHDGRREAAVSGTAGGIAEATTDSEPAQQPVVRLGQAPGRKPPAPAKTSAARRAARREADSDRPAVVICGLILGGGRSPCAGAEIRVTELSGETTGPEGRELARTTSDEAGRYEAQCREVPQRVVVNASHAGFAPTAAAVSPQSAPEERGTRVVNLDLELQRAALLRGVVVDGAKRPVAGAGVVASRSTAVATAMPNAPETPLVQSWSASTGADGAFALEGLPDHAALDVVVTKERFITLQLQASAPDTLFVTLGTEGGTIEGQVFLLAGGEAAPGAMVRVTRIIPEAAQPPETRTARTDDLGSFRFEGLPLGAYRISAEKDTLRLAPIEDNPGNQVDVSAAGESRDLKLYLYPGHTISGTVTEDGTRTPVEGAEVAVAAGYAKSVRTAADGTYHLGGVSLDATGAFLPVLISKEGYETREAELVRLDPRQPEVKRDFQIKLALRVSGRVVNTEGAGIPAATVVMHGDRREQETGTGTDGRYEFPAVPGFGFLIAATAPGYGTEWGPMLKLDRESTTVADIVLSFGASVSGTVVDENDNPVGDAQVTAWLIDRDEKQEFPVGKTGSPTASDANGNFELLRLPPRTVALRGYKPGYLDEQFTRRPRVTLQAGEQRTGVRLKLRKGNHVSGTVTDRDGKPLRALVWALSGGADTRPASSCFAMDDGHFTLNELAAAELTVFAGCRGFESTQIPNVRPSRDGLRLVLSTARPVVLIGRVTDKASGEPLEGFKVRIQGSQGVQIMQGGPQTSIEGPGIFTMKGLDSGSIFQLVIDCPGYLRMAREFQQLQPMEETMERAFGLERAPDKPSPTKQ